MAGFTLDNLIQAIAAAVTQAQEKVRRHQIAVIGSYFDENNRPVAVDVRLPSLAKDAQEGDERVVKVPLLALAGHHALNIKEMEVSFEVNLGGIFDSEPPAEGAPTDGSKNDGSAPPDPASPMAWASRHSRKALGVDMGATRKSDVGTKAQVTLKVVSDVPSEGMARLIQHLDKMI